MTWLAMAFDPETLLRGVIVGVVGALLVAVILAIAHRNNS